MPRVFNRKPTSKKKVKMIWSRFSRQIMRQAALQKKGWVTGALFLDERFQNTAGFDPLGSIFVPHQHLAPVLGTKVGKAWGTQDVRALAHSYGVNVKVVMEGVVNCSNGFPTATVSIGEMLASLRAEKYEPTDLEREMEPQPKEPPIVELPDTFRLPEYARVPTIIERDRRARP